MTNDIVLAQIKTGDLLIIKLNGMGRRLSAPTPVLNVTKTEIVTRITTFKKSDGKEVQEPRYIKNDEGQRVREPLDPYPATIVRLATAEDIAKHEAELEESRKNREAIESRNTHMESIAALFPMGMRPAVSDAWNNVPRAFHLEFDGLTDEQVKQLAAAVAQVLKAVRQ